MLHGEIVMENVSKKKVFSRKVVVVALAVICVVLLAGLVGTLVFLHFNS